MQDKIDKLKCYFKTIAVVGLVLATSYSTAIGGELETTDTVAMAEATTDGSSVAELGYAVDNMVLMFCAVLVIFMQAGFAMLEIGLNEAKNTLNILSKNVMDLAVGIILFFVVGYGLMYPGEAYQGGWFGFGGVGVSDVAPAAEAGNLHPQIDFLFQVAFAATAATIVSGAVAGRMKFTGYVIYSAIITGCVYPICGMWKWGGGWLDAMGFHDFAGSVLVHAVGGFAGLAGAIVLGPRIGRFVKGKSRVMPGHNLAFAALGVLVLWVGWYGFNPGSQLAFVGAANTNATVSIALNTTLAAAAGAILALVVTWFFFGKPDVVMAMNGALAGLVGITASCDMVTNEASVAIGAIAGILVVGATILLDKLRIDDPVGAWPVHGVCGLWGGIAAGIFGTANLTTQLIGCLVIVSWSFSTMLAVFYLLKVFNLLRVSAAEEHRGLDISEHGMRAYPLELPAELKETGHVSPEAVPVLGA